MMIQCTCMVCCISVVGRVYITLQELFYGGYVAPDIYYLGQTGCVRFRGLRIAGVSGIHNSGNFFRTRRERPPYDNGTVRSVYHVRACDVTRMARLGGEAPDVNVGGAHDGGAAAGGTSGRARVDVFLSHDWPRGIAHFGNCASLLKKKPFLRGEVEDGSLGCPYGRELMLRLRPQYWFSAHLHVKFAAVVRHRSAGGGSSSSVAGASVTRFLALDKVLPNRDFLQLVDIEPPEGCGGESTHFEYDPEWLAILRATHGTEMNRERDRPTPGAPPDPGPTRQEVEDATRRVRHFNKSHGRTISRDGGEEEDVDGSMEIPMLDEYFRTVRNLHAMNVKETKFVLCTLMLLYARMCAARLILSLIYVCVYVCSLLECCQVRPANERPGRMPTSLVLNPQTLSLLEMLGLPLHCDPATASLSGAGNGMANGSYRSQSLIQQHVPQQHTGVVQEELDNSDPNEIELE